MQCTAPPSGKDGRSGLTIGTLSEYQLHRELKAYFMADPLFHEQPVGPYVADIRCGNEIVEIQSKDLYKMKAKLDYYLSEGFSVTVVYPVVLEKRLFWLDLDTGRWFPPGAVPKKDGFWICLGSWHGFRPILHGKTFLLWR